MRLSKIYTNYPTRFEPVFFNAGLNVILAEIRIPENRDKDTHNLGKTTLSQLIDYCLLKGKSQDFFLFKNIDLFRGFEFYLEIATNSNQYITVRRTVDQATKIAFMKHSEPHLDLSGVHDDDWDHVNVPFEKAKQLLDGFLDLRAISPWPYRSALGYSLRIQKDYQSVFQLDKFRGPHVDWKPFIAHLMGFDSALVSENYRIALEIENTNQEERRTKGELADTADDLDKLDGTLLVLEREILSLEKEVSDYNFNISEQEINKDLVDDVEKQIAHLNDARYSLTMSKSRVEEALSNKISFSVKRAQKLFEEANIYFGDQIINEFQDLIRFNQVLSVEREGYLRTELISIENDIQQVEHQLNRYNAERSKLLALLRDKETFSKYKKMNARLVDKKADYETLRRRRSIIKRLHDLRKKIIDLKIHASEVRAKIEANIEAGNDTYKSIRINFSEIIKATIDRNAIISTKVNKEGNLEFSTDILNDTGAETSQGFGHTYRKLLCIAFDLALIKSYLSSSYIRFVYHDGILETLDDRKKENLIAVMRKYAAAGVQQIVTAIDSDLPLGPEGERIKFSPDEVVLVLHDEGQSGRLFKHDMW